MKSLNLQGVTFAGAVWVVPMLLLLASPATLRAQFTFTTNNGAITITSYTGNATTLKIPSTTNGFPVTSIGDHAFYGNYYLTNVVIPNSVTSLADYSFAGCTLISVTIGSAVTNIGNYAFFDDETLTHVSIPNSVITLGDCSFDECITLTNVTFGNSLTQIGGYAFSQDSDLLQANIPNSVVNLGDGAFYYCTSMTNATIGSKVANLGENSFGGCTSLTNVTIGGSVTNIADNAFNGDQSLLRVSIPDNVLSIGTNAFYTCTSLTNVAIGNGVTSIGDQAFAECNSLIGATIGSGVTNLGDGAFTDCYSLLSISVNTNNPAYVSVAGVLFNRDQTTLIQYPAANAMTSYTIPDSVTDIKDFAFWSCASLLNVFIGANVTNLETYAFGGCNLISLYFAGNAPSDDGTEFYDDHATVYYAPGTTGWDTSFGGLTTVAWMQQGPFTYTAANGAVTINRYIGSDGAVTIPDTIEGLPVTSLAGSAFYGCDSFTNVIIGTNVASIGPSAFYNCGRLATVSIPDSITNISDSAFELSGLDSISLPNSITSLGSVIFGGCGSLTNVNLGTNITSIGGQLFAGCTSLASVEMPDSVTTIGDYAFNFCGLISVNLPNGVTSIGNYAFANCSSLIHVTMGTNVESIGQAAFLSCSNLASLVIPDSVTSIQGGTFEYCSKLAQVVIGNNVTQIGMSAFQNCGLANIVIPNAVTNINYDAFNGCTNLTKVIFGTNLDSIYFAAFYGCSRLTGVYFLGNAPTKVEPDVFGSDPNATIYYLPGATGWSSPLYGLPAVELSVSKPIVAITSPVNGQRWSNSVFTVTGTANDKVLVSSVWFRVNAGDWQPVTTSNQWATWTATASLTPGTNFIQAAATNVFGSGSTLFSVNPDYVVNSQLGVHTVGLGTLSPNYSNAVLEIGRNYSLKATPAAGFTFTNWTVSTNWIGAALTNAATLQFMMASNLTVQAGFVDTQIPILTITAPNANQRMTNAIAAVSGTASDNWKVSAVWYQLNNAAWNPASTANNWTNWNTTVPLIAGTNTLQAYAVDLGGNHSAAKSVSFVSSNTFKLQLALPSAPPLLTNGLTFTLQLSSNLNGHIEYSTNLLNWTSWTNFRGTNTAINFRDPSATNSIKRFYRAVVP